MAKTKRKSLHARLVRQMRRDLKDSWTGEFIEFCRHIGRRRGWQLSDITDDPLLQGDALTPEDKALAFEDEAIICQFYESYPLRECTDPFLYPGLIFGWETRPKVVEFSAAAVEEFARDPEAFDGATTENLRRLFPGSVMVDLRAVEGRLDLPFQLEAAFAWTAYDEDLDATVVLILGIGDLMLLDPLESKVVLGRDATLGQTLEANEVRRRREYAMGTVLAPFGRAPAEGDYFEADREDDDFARLVMRLLCMACSRAVDVRVVPVDGVPTYKVSPHDPTKEIEPGPELEPELEPEAGQGPEAEGVEAGAEFAEAEEQAGFAEITEIAGTCAPSSTIVESAAVEPPEAGAPAATPGSEIPADSKPKPEPEPVEWSEPKSEPATPATPEIAALMERYEAIRHERDEAVRTAASAKAAARHNLDRANKTAESLRDEVEALRVRAELVETMRLPRTPLAALELAEQAFPDRLVVLERARESARSFDRGDVSEVWDVLRSMATTLHALVFDKTDGAGGAGVPSGAGSSGVPGGAGALAETSADISSAFENAAGFELALRYPKATAQNAECAKIRQVLYKGKPHDITPHVKGRSNRPGEALRVHFFADYEERKLVIGYCGSHLKTVANRRMG